ncbi:MAG TPA: hypothetical protein VF021_10485 [Longimicrobiales bacterium]
MTQNEVLLQTAMRRLNARAWGIAVGLLLGGGLFIATNLLVMQGGPYMGQHLALLRVYFPGYNVSFIGSLIGFVYAFVIGYGLGRLVGTTYNWLANPEK